MSPAAPVHAGDDDQAMITLQQVVKTFRNAAGEFTVLKGIDLTLLRGEFVSIVGKSGSGKSTLLNMMTGIDHPSAGRVVIGGVDLYRMSESQRSLWRGRNLGIVFQFFQLLPMLTVLENVMLPMDYVDAFAFSDRPQRALELLERVGLSGVAGKLPHAISTGQQQLAAIARALATDPPVIVADEPTGNLDSRSAAAIIDLFEELVAAGKTIVMVTHDPSLTARTDRNIIISDGELIDETVSLCLPLLSHRQMLDVSKQASRLLFQPGQSILQRDQHVDSFFMVARGEVEVVLTGSRRQDRILARLGPGEFFGEVELLRGGKSLAGVRAAPDSSVALLSLDREAFNAVLSHSPMTAEAVGSLVQKRLQEHRSAARRSLLWPFLR